MTHPAPLWVGAISHTMLLLIIAGMVGRARRRLVTDQTIFYRILAIVANQAFGHARFDHVTVEVFPGGDAGVAATAFNLFMPFMGKKETGRQSLALTHCFAGLFEVTQPTITFFAGFKMTFQAALLARPPKSITDFLILPENAADVRGNDSGRPQWLPAGRDSRRNRRAAFAVDVADGALN